MRAPWLAALAAGAFALGGCGLGADEPPGPMAPVEVPGEAAGPAGPAEAVPADSLQRRQPGALGTVQTAPVDFGTDTLAAPFEVALRTREQVGGHARAFGTVSRGIALRVRTPDLTQYPCTSCHLGLRVVMADERVRDAHQNIRPMHPRATGAVCATCHAPDDVERLAVKGGDRPTLDHSYRLCAQCHFEQARAWAAGAHGKRLDGWQGRRVVMGCADCHDPHAPALEPRIPVRGPTLPARGGH